MPATDSFFRNLPKTHAVFALNSILLLPFLQPHLEDLISSNASVSSRMLETAAVAWQRQRLPPSWRR